MVTELAANGELLNVINARGRMSEAIAKKIFKQMLAAMANMHRSHIVNRDIKLDNLLVGPGPEYRILMTDYGFATVLEG